MVRKFALLSLAVATLVAVVVFSAVGSDNQLACFACGGGVVDKAHAMISQ